MTILFHHWDVLEYEGWQERTEIVMAKKYLRLFIVFAVVLGIALLAKGQVAWAEQDNAGSAVGLEQGELAVLPAKPGPGTVKPPPGQRGICYNGLVSIGGVVTLEIKDLKPGYCVEAVLWNPRFHFKRFPDGAGSPLAHLLFLRIYYHGRLTYELPMEDGTVDACYAIPPEKQGQFYFYDFYGKRFGMRTEQPESWELLETRVDADNKIACAFTQISGAYSLVGK
jgi:hypothetical protein